MFDKLVESTKQKQGGRARWLFLVTGAIYAVTLTALGIATVIGFRTALAEEYDTTCLIPPVPLGPDPTPAQIKPNLKSAPDAKFMAPKPTTPPPDLDKLNIPPNWGCLPVPGANNPTGIGDDGIPGAPRERETPPPPPPPMPTLVVKPAATPTADGAVRLTSKLTQGRVLRKVQPPYPTIARQVRVQGSVQVQIAISETGVVTDVTPLSGHPLLREAALQAAKQWLFIPTQLNGRPARAIGLLTFNFVLN